MDDVSVFQYPELVFGLVGPIGIDVTMVQEAIDRSLHSVGYTSNVVHITKDLTNLENYKLNSGNNFRKRYRDLIAIGNKFRSDMSDNSAMARLALFRIVNLRECVEIHEISQPSPNVAYIVRQLKRPEEVDLLKKLYGSRFIQVSMYASEEVRLKNLIDKIKLSGHGPQVEAEIVREAEDLIEIDKDEKLETSGQRIDKLFHRGDVFVRAMSKEQVQGDVERFVRALFGANDASPTHDEYGLYIASAAALRSVDLSRQIGAAIFSDQGEILAMGANEVPKPGGGTYWTDDPERHRDIELKKDTNQKKKIELIADFLQRLKEDGFLKGSVLDELDTDAQVDKVINSTHTSESQALDLIEFGRMIHAEMCAITDAARLGHKVSGATLYTTTFPCHLCAKHIVSSGIQRVVFLDPYPKSYANEFHSDSIELDPAKAPRVDDHRVRFEHFVGIAPQRYQSIFRKENKRKDNAGVANEWYFGSPKPMVHEMLLSYLKAEEEEILPLGPFIDN